MPKYNVLAKIVIVLGFFSFDRVKVLVTMDLIRYNITL